MQPGRQECRPSDGPATLLSPMVAMEICFLQSVPKLVLVEQLLGNWICGREILCDSFRHLVKPAITGLGLAFFGFGQALDTRDGVRERQWHTVRRRNGAVGGDGEDLEAAVDIASP